MVKQNKWKRRISNWMTLLVTTVICLILAEFIFRALLFGNFGFMKQVRKPEYFSEISSPEYWKLCYHFGREIPPEKPHPELGWIGRFHETHYMHRDIENLQRKRPVLLYGDSFAMCVDSVQCFEDILNQDTSFTKNHFLLNYGVGGYGVGQAALLASKTTPHYDRPFVVFSMLTTDIDRTILPVRTGQKPYFDIEKDKLRLRGYPIYDQPEAYFKKNPPKIRSYLYRRFLFSNINFLPYRISSRLKKKYHYIEKKQAVNELLIERVARELRENDIEFVFMVFHFEDDMMSPHSEENWRDQFFRRVLEENEIPYIWTKGIIRDHREKHPDNSHDHYIIPGNGHPTTLYNQLISDEIKRIVLTGDSTRIDASQNHNPAFFEHRIAAMEQQILADSAWKSTVATKAVQEGRDFSTQLHYDAVFAIERQLTAPPR